MNMTTLETLNFITPKLSMMSWERPVLDLRLIFGHFKVLPSNCALGYAFQVLINSLSALSPSLRIELEFLEYKHLCYKIYHISTSSSLQLHPH